MRALAVLAVLTLATPAAAQVDAVTQHQLMEAQAQAELARQRSIAVESQLMSLEARLQAEQGIATSRAQVARPYLPLPAMPEPPGADRAKIDTSKLVSIPDDRLAASNAAVLEASRPR